MRETKNIGQPRAQLSSSRRLLKNSDNTSPGCGVHLNVCIHTLSCIALTRGVVKIIQTDPDSFFFFFFSLVSFRSGTLSSGAPCALHPRIPSSSLLLLLFLFELLPSFSVILMPFHSSSSSSSTMPLSTRCLASFSLAIVPSRGVEFEIAKLFDYFAADDLTSLRSTCWDNDFEDAAASFTDYNRE